MSWTRRFRFLSIVFVLLAAAAGVAAAVDGPQGVSPGSLDRIATMRDGCTTFSWQALEGAASYELVAYALAEGATIDTGFDPNQVSEVLFVSLPGGVTSWTPEVADCLAPGGRYAWFVRAVLDVETGEATEWSAPMLFTVLATPSVAEVEQALNVLLRYVEEDSEPDGRARSGPNRREIADLVRSAGEKVASRSVQTGTAAIRGEQLDPSGETYGVVGASASPDGAGLGAANTGGGPDLVLDGSADGVADTAITESGLDRPSTWGTTFLFENSGPGPMTLKVDGVNVVTTATDQDTPPRDPGNQLSLSGNALDVVEGPGSGLDADTLDGRGAWEFAPVIHLHDTRYFTETELSDPGAGGAVHWDNLAGVPPGFADGIDDNTTYAPGTGLVLDGSEIRLDSRMFFIQTSSLDVDVSWVQTSIAKGVDGLGLVGYFSADTDLRAAHCDDILCTAATVTTLDSGAGNVGMFPSVAIGADGLGLISYYDGLARDLKVAHCDDVACTSATFATLDSVGDVGEYVSVAIGADGLGLISYHDWTNDDLKVAHCNDVECSTATLAILDNIGDVGTGSSVAIGSDGLGLIGYFDATNLDLKVAHCDNTLCNSATVSTLDSTGSVGRFASLATGADGLGLISYLDWTNKDLKVAHCNDVECNTATLSTLDNVGDVGFYTSVVIGADGLGLISYQDLTNRDLRVATCNDTVCSSAALRTVDAAGSVGSDCSIVIGADGLGLISYSENIDGTLKVAHLPYGW